MFLDPALLKLGWTCKCPSCGKGDLYKSGISLNLRSACSVCGLDLSKNDSADGPAVFLIFILGFTIVPLALFVEMTFSPPLWLHITLWPPLALAATLATLRPLKAYIIALQFRHRPESWNK